MTYHKILKNPLIGEQVIMKKRIIFFLPTNIVITLLFLFLFAAIIFLILIYFIIDKRRLFLIFLSISLLFCLLLTIIFFIQYNNFNKKVFIVTSKIANIHIAPDEYETILLSVPEGTKGRIIEKITDYMRIDFADDSSGWIKKEDIIY